MILDDFDMKRNEDGTVSLAIQKVKPDTHKITISQRNNDSEGNNYPLDVWFLISEYICPEDVGIFGAICKTSFEVICSSRFWFNLYRRYYKNIPGLPQNLKPERLVRKYGLKTNVIRALYHMYPQFVNRTLKEEHPASLKNYQCQLLWFNLQEKNCIYYFKLKRFNWKSAQSRKESKQVNLLEILEDITANPDEDCRVLKVSCLHFNPVESVVGLTLKSVSLTVSSAPMFLYQRLQLIFSSGIGSSSKLSAGPDSTTVILDPVINIKILDWWHPLYPVNRNGMEELMPKD
ncbi:hypothetical protein ABEB36_005807 [Hypothenemus hampei]|uniref:Transmembrane protein 183 n=1 Tax=Hypothenemus hampei TaxID=57062 RepID=A0ABD1EZG2_HYPHA